MRAFRRLGKGGVAVLGILLVAGVALAVLYVSNVLNNSSTVSGTALTLGYDPASPHPESFTFVGTTYTEWLVVTNNAATTLSPDLAVSITKTGISVSDVTLTIAGATVTPTLSGNTLTFTHASGLTLSPGNQGAITVTVVYNTAGSYSWSQQVSASA